MPLSSILILVGVVAAFIIFGLALAWGQFQTQNLIRNEDTGAAEPREQRQFKKAA